MGEASPLREARAASGRSVRGAPPSEGRGRGWLAGISDALVSVFFPAGCRICEELLTSASRVPICEACLDSFVQVPKPACDVCGRPLPAFCERAGICARNEGRALLCQACRDKTYAFERARSFAVYEGALVQAILLLKYEQIEPLGRVVRGAAGGGREGARQRAGGGCGGPDTAAPAAGTRARV
jgi:hypothetical protein